MHSSAHAAVLSTIHASAHAEVLSTMHASVHAAMLISTHTSVPAAVPVTAGCCRSPAGHPLTPATSPQSPHSLVHQLTATLTPQCTTSLPPSQSSALLSLQSHFLHHCTCHHCTEPRYFTVTIQPSLPRASHPHWARSEKMNVRECQGRHEGSLKEFPGSLSFIVSDYCRVLT